MTLIIWLFRGTVR